MEGFKEFWNGQTLLIGGVTLVLAIAAAALNQGIVSTVFGLVSGTAFMWMARPEPPPDSDEIEEV